MIDQDRIVNSFCELVKIDSPSDEEEEVAQYLIPILENLGFSVASLLIYGLLLVAVMGQNLPIYVVLLVCAVSVSVLESGRYIYFRLRGKTDEELNPDEYRTDTITLKSDLVIFGGNAGYKSISLNEITNVSYTPSDSDYQEVTFTFEDKGGFVYSLNNTAEYVAKAVETINKSLLLMDVEKSPK